MSDLPDDILKTAGGVVADICDDTRMTLMGDVEKMAQPIAAAIYAERKRCADIVKGWGLANGADAILSPSTRGE